MKIKTLILASLSMLIFHTESQAQLTTAMNLQPIFSGFSGTPQFMLKYGLNNGQIAIRLAGGGSSLNFASNQNFLEDEAYTNLDKWPTAISKDGNTGQSTNTVIMPGLEYRIINTENNRFYAGIAMIYSKNRSESSNNFHQFTQVSQTMYTITRVGTSSNSWTNTSYGARLLIGYERHLKHGVSLFAEASIGSSRVQSKNDSEFTIYNWDAFAEEFELQDNNQLKFKDQDQPWNSTVDLTPTVSLHVAYTFSKKKAE